MCSERTQEGEKSRGAEVCLAPGSDQDQNTPKKRLHGVKK